MNAHSVEKTTCVQHIGRFTKKNRNTDIDRQLDKMTNANNPNYNRIIQFMKWMESTLDRSIVERTDILSLCSHVNEIFGYNLY